ncbi:MAG: SDR family NAD(P)-dependent oxidoreductase, partial [Acidimicrobiales bacterium]
MTRVAVVTGGARGIGAATVRGLAAAGWAVLAVDRAGDDSRLPYGMGSEAELHGVVATALAVSPQTTEASPDAERVVAHVADTADPDAMVTAVARAEELYGGVDAMVAVAGVIAGGVPLLEMPREQLAAVLEVDLGGAVNAARAAVPALLRRP